MDPSNKQASQTAGLSFTPTTYIQMYKLKKGQGTKELL